jgi:ribosomal protein S27E
MYIPAPTHEDVADFMTTTLLCNQCKHETAVSGPLPTRVKCPQCGSKDVVPISVTISQSTSSRRAA